MWVNPREHPDFGWAWVTRFLVQLGNALGTLYLLYFLTDKVKVALDEGKHDEDTISGIVTESRTESSRQQSTVGASPAHVVGHPPDPFFVPDPS